MEYRTSSSRKDDLDSAAAGLITGMIARLAEFEPLRCAKWIGELLGTAPDIVFIEGNNDKIPKRIQAARKGVHRSYSGACSVNHSWSDTILKDELCNGLQLYASKDLVPASRRYCLGNP